ncbi:MAG: DegQ family serine endoprotease [Ectothiorhodospira sp.]
MTYPIPAMRRLLACLILGVLVLHAPGVVAQTFPAGSSEEKPTLAPVVRKAQPAVVNVSTVQQIEQAQHPLFQDPFFRRFFELPDLPQRRQNSLGSGVIIDADKGYILTNHHVIAQADEVSVTLKDGREFKARQVGSDPETDIAVLRIDASDLTELPLGEMDGLEVGDLVIAIGNPFGLGHTVTSGIVSALGRTGLGIEGYEDFIQTDASINPGNSGGALIDWKGRLVGLNTAIVGPNGGNVGIGFAIPVDMVKALSRQIIEHGQVRRGRLGVYIQDVTPRLAEALELEEAHGALIARVMPGSPVEKAGLKEGDVVVSVQDKAVKDAADLRNRIGLLSPDQKIDIGYLRDGESRSARVTLGGDQEVVEADNGRWQHRALPGAWLTSLPGDHPLGGRVDGILVDRVEPRSPAAGAGLRRGDVIDQIQRTPVADRDEARRVLDAVRGEVLLRVLRGRSALFLVVRPGD